MTIHFSDSLGHNMKTISQLV